MLGLERPSHRAETVFSCKIHRAKVFGVRKKKGAKEEDKHEGIFLETWQIAGGGREKRKTERTLRPNAHVLYAASAPPVIAPYDLARVFS